MLNNQRVSIEGVQLWGCTPDTLCLGMIFFNRTGDLSLKLVELWVFSSKTSQSFPGKTLVDVDGLIGPSQPGLLSATWSLPWTRWAACWPLFSNLGLWWNLDKSRGFGPWCSINGSPKFQWFLTMMFQLKLTFRGILMSPPFWDKPLGFAAS